MDGRCATCRHWNDEPSTMVAPYGWGSCGLAGIGGDDPDDEQEEAGVAVYGYYGNDQGLITAPFFGCVGYKPNDGG